jgi:hypothetical protein
MWKIIVNLLKNADEAFEETCKRISTSYAGPAPDLAQRCAFAPVESSAYAHVFLF